MLRARHITGLAKEWGGTGTRQWTNRFSAQKTTASGKKRQVQLSDVSVSLPDSGRMRRGGNAAHALGQKVHTDRKIKQATGRTTEGWGL